MVEYSVPGIVGRIDIDDPDFSGEPRKKELEDIEIVALDQDVALEIEGQVGFEKAFGRAGDLFFGHGPSGPGEMGSHGRHWYSPYVLKS